MTSSLTLLTMRTLNDNNGTAEYGTTSALSIASCKSGMAALAGERSPLLESREKSANFAPDFCAARKSAPVRADQADKLVTFIDGNEIVLRHASPSHMPDAIDKQCCHIRGHVI